MNNSMRRIRGAFGMGFTWAAGWAVAGVMIGVASNLLPGLPWNSFFDVFDAPLPALAIPGFVAGTLFSVVLGIAARRRKFNELSLPKFAAWGAVGGLLLSLVPVVMVGIGVLTGDTRHSLWQVSVAIGGPFIVLSAISASVSLVLARRAHEPESVDAQSANELRSGERLDHPAERTDIKSPDRLRR